jgi:hypothetical protein
MALLGALTDLRQALTFGATLSAKDYAFATEDVIKSVMNQLEW